MPLRIFDLRERPEHTGNVAHRVWSTFWRHDGTPFEKIREGTSRIVANDRGVPFALVAEMDGRPCGNALVIDNDEPARPDLAPWVAAVVVDAPFRGQGVARAMIDDATRRCRTLGLSRVYLVSRPALRPFYTGLGWRELEDEVGADRQVLYARELGAVASPP